MNSTKSEREDLKLQLAFIISLIERVYNGCILLLSCKECMFYNLTISFHAIIHDTLNHIYYTLSSILIHINFTHHSCCFAFLIRRYLVHRQYSLQIVFDCGLFSLMV